MSNIYIHPNFYTTKPNSSDREEKEMKVYDLLETLQIPYVGVDHEAAHTIEACIGVDEVLGTNMCKNLFLCNTQKTKFYLLLLPGSKKFRTADLSKQLQSPRLSFAPAEYMEEFLNIKPGAVSILGLMNDKDCNVKLLIDRELMTQEYLGCHPCVNTSSLKIKLSDILDKFLPYVNHPFTIVDLPNEK